jgi:GNAT superfamily N-acetyltransferase
VEARDPVCGLSPAEKTRVYEQTLAAEYLRWMRAWIADHPDRGFAAERVAGTEDAPGAVIAGPRDAIITDTMGVGYDGPVSAEQMDAIEAVFRRCDSVPEIECTPYADPSLLGHLRERGYGVVNYLQVFWLDLTTPPAEWVEGIEVRQIDKSDLADVALAARTIAMGMESRVDEPTGPGLTIAEQVASCKEIATFVALINGEPVGGSSCGVWDRHPLCGPHLNVYGGSTLPWARGRGVQRALMLARLRWGHERGARSASMDCKPMIASERNALRLGFELVCTKGVFIREPYAGGE